MTKDEFRKAAEEMNSKAQSVKKDTAAAGTAQVWAPQPPSLGLLVPKPPFGMPVIPVIQNVKIIKPEALPVKDDESKES